MNAVILKSKAAHRQSNTVKNIEAETIEKPQYLSFTDFVKKRKIQETKALGRRRSKSIEREMYEKDKLLYEEEEEEENDKIDEYPFKV